MASQAEVEPVGMEAMGYPKMTCTAWGKGEFPVARDTQAEGFWDDR